MMNKQEFYNKVTEQTGIELSEKQKNQYQRYYELVVEWNQKINLTAITEEEEFYSKHFYDSISLAFLNLLKDELELTNCNFIHARAEEIGQKKDYREKFEIVTARAVARLNVLSELCLPLVRKNGYFLSLKAQKAEEETKEALNAIKLLGGKLEKDLEFSIEGEERHILEIRKAKETPNKYPRKVGTPNKKPLY